MMLTFCRALVNAAARRWPEQSEMRQEWLAELDFLAAKRRPLKVVSFAAGLALARPAHAPAIGLTWRTTGTAAFLLAGPLTLMSLMFVLEVAVVQLIAPALAIAPAELAWTLLTVFVLLAYLTGRWWGARSVIAGPVALAVTLGLSITVSLLAAPRLVGSEFHLHQILIGIVVWSPALFVLIFFAANAAQRRRGVRAMLGGLLAWLVALDVAVIVEFWPRVGSVDPQAPAGSMFVGEHAPMWFIYALTKESFSVLNSFEELTVGDTTVFMPQALIIYAVFAMAYAITAVHAARPSS
ncbi:hypothetical protein Rhe02_05450 [Rhizocola hellebori]|uniref:Uncharacterized protein n=1 Tax=Rhizocola hellebori TaxID=1392758 RepID=A0A8J3Q268_9ACTN|nr:hypothetical protein [Rhizocola hellebori]GIH02478.1 hypothetical protein Rhe02_05450 [Rhizocola hellebori]